MRKGILVTRQECPWLHNDLKQGTTVYEYDGCTYGSVGDGVAVTLEPDMIPFVEVPEDSVDWETEDTAERGI